MGPGDPVDCALKKISIQPRGVQMTPRQLSFFLILVQKFHWIDKIHFFSVWPWKNQAQGQTIFFFFYKLQKPEI